MALTPADPSRCQAEITPAHSFMTLGPREKPYRCPNKPVVIARENQPGKDGQVGEMSLCESCWRVCQKQMSPGSVSYRSVSQP